MKLFRVLSILLLVFVVGCESKDYSTIEEEIKEEKEQVVEVVEDVELIDEESDLAYQEVSVATSVGLSMQVLSTSLGVDLEHVTLEDGYQNVLVDVLIKNESAAEYYHLETYEFYLFDDFGMQYFYESGWYDSPMQYAMLSPKGLHRGTLLYQIPIDRTPESLQYFYLTVPLTDFTPPVHLLQSEFEGFIDVEHEMGDVIKTTDLTVQVIQVSKSNETADHYLNYGYKYLFVDVILLNETDHELNYSNNNFRLTGSNGDFIYPSQYFWQSMSGTLEPNERKWIKLAYERPLEDDWYLMLYQTEFYTDEAYINLTTGRTEKLQLGDLTPTKKLYDLIQYETVLGHHLYTVQFTSFEITDDYYVLNYQLKNEGEELDVSPVNYDLYLPHNYSPTWGETDNQPTYIQDSSLEDHILSHNEIQSMTTYYDRETMRERGNHYYVLVGDEIVDLEEVANIDLMS